MDPPKDRKEGETSHLGAIVLLVMFGILAALVCGETWQALKALPPYVGRTLTEEETAEVIEGNSPLTSYVYLSPNADFPRNAKISKITIHHMAGQLTLEELGVSFAKRDRNASSNYGIDSSGKVGLYVEEANRSWASSNAENDHMAVTIEVANEEIGGSWKVSGEAYQTLIDLFRRTRATRRTRAIQRIRRIPVTPVILEIPMTRIPRRMEVRTLIRIPTRILLRFRMLRRIPYRR